MTDTQTSGLIRIGGAAILASFAIHIAVNMWLKEFPPETQSVEELKAYFTREAGVWALSHGLRNIAIVGMALFLGGLYARTAPAEDRAPGWAVVGLVGGVLHIASLFVANGLETFAFLDFSYFAEKPELFWLVFRATRVLFTAEIAVWSVFLFGFSMAGWQNATLPKWICAIGFFSAAACLLSGAFIVSILKSGKASVFTDIAELSALAWFVCAGVFMMLRGKR